MSIPRQLAEQVLAIPNGVGTVTGLGETFAADPFTGTSRFRMPISAPAGHGGLAPSVDITYSSGAGAGICGVGWAFGVGSIRRGVRKGIPRFTDEDVFMLGDDELVPLADGYFVRRTEGSFARIRHVRSALEDFWVVTEKNGVRSIYGRDPQSRDGEASKITAWHLTEMRNPNNHAVTYTYVRDEKNHRAYLDRVEWALGAYRMELRYEERPDVLRSARSGVNTITRRRLTEIHMRVRHRDTDAFTTFDSYRFTYKQSPITGLSLLTTVTRMGIDAQGNTKSWPTLSLGYTTGEAAPTPIEVKGHAGRPLSDPDLQLVDLNGDGYPDLLESTSTGWLLRQNTGDGCFARAVPISGPLTRLASPDVFLSDMDGRLRRPSHCARVLSESRQRL